MLIKKTSILVFLFLLWAPTSFAAQPHLEGMYQDARRQFYALLSSEKKMNNRSEWRKAINKFKIIEQNRPNSKRAKDSIYNIGLLYERLYFRSGRKIDKKASIKSFRAVITRFPKSKLAPHAQRHIGDIQFRGSETGKAVKAYKRAKKTTNGKNLSQLVSVKRFSRDGYTRLILNLSNRTAYTAHKIKNPGRIFVDLLDTGIRTSIPKVITYNAGMAKSLRIAKNSVNITRVVVGLSEKHVSYNVTALNNPFRIVIDLGRITKQTVSSKQASRKASPATKHTRIVALPTRQTSRIRMIVIDPGHGGKDPGAIGPTGLKEKDVTLAIAKRLKKTLEKRMKCRVAMTRNDDRFMELDERTVIANSLKADMFISIHVNAHKNSRARGVETYFLSPARSKDELATAARENMISLHSDDEVENDLAYIMSDLANTSKLNESAQLAGSVQHSTIKNMRRSYLGIKDKGVRQAMFYVLWRATMPSVLVETGFITNAKEESRLRKKAYINKMADAIADGVYKYGMKYIMAENR